jgi:putative phage-type endonuclease
LARYKKIRAEADRKICPGNQTKGQRMVEQIVAHFEKSANYLGDYAPGDTAWADLREGRIGGSEVGAIAGESRYESAYSLWAKKLGLIPNYTEENEAMYWGRALEPVIAQRFLAEHQDWTHATNLGSWANKQHDFMFASPDGAYIKPDGTIGILEIKTARYQDDWANGVPKYYLTQVQWYMNCFNVSEAYVAILFSGSEYREYLVEADKMWQQYDLKMVIDFLKAVETKERPSWDGSEATLTAVRRQHPEIDASATYDLEDLGVQYDLALDKLEEQKSEVNQLQSMVLDAMGTAKTGLVYDIPRFIRTSRNGGTPYLTRKKSK